MVRRRSTVRFRFGALPVLWRDHSLQRRGSSVGASARLIIVRSSVRVPPPLTVVRSASPALTKRRVCLHRQSSTSLERYHRTVGTDNTQSCPTGLASEEAPVATKTADIRPKITLACTVCKERNYITKKNRRNNPDRLDLMKHCPRCNAHTTHRETR